MALSYFIHCESPLRLELLSRAHELMSYLVDADGVTIDDSQTVTAVTVLLHGRFEESKRFYYTIATYRDSVGVGISVSKEQRLRAAKLALAVGSACLSVTKMAQISLCAHVQRGTWGKLPRQRHTCLKLPCALLHPHQPQQLLLQRERPQLRKL